MNVALERAEASLELAEFQAVQKQVILARYPDVLSYEGFVTAMPAVRYPLAPSHPFGPPTVSGTTVTVDQMLRTPTRITRQIMNLTLQRFIARPDLRQRWRRDRRRGGLRRADHERAVPHT
jgi:hypothetical protein